MVLVGFDGVHQIGDDVGNDEFADSIVVEFVEEEGVVVVADEVVVEDFL